MRRYDPLPPGCQEETLDIAGKVILYIYTVEENDWQEQPISYGEDQQLCYLTSEN